MSNRPIDGNNDPDLTELARGGLEGLALIEHLRRSLDPARARSAAERVQLLRRAARKLDPGIAWHLTGKALEQASHRQVARFRARTIAALEPEPRRRVIDGTAGAGGDATEMARAGLTVVACEQDAELSVLLARNIELASPERPCIALRASALELPLAKQVVRDSYFVADPDRRAAGRRELDPERWSPPLSRLIRVAAEFRGAWLKLAPALEPSAMELPDSLDHAWVWMARGAPGGGELTELGLVCGALAEPFGRGGPGRRCVVRLHGDEVLRLDGLPQRDDPQPRELEPLEPRQAANVARVAEADAAVLRAGLLGSIAAGWRPLGRGLGFLGPAASADSDLAGAPSPWLATWRVLESCALDRRAVRAMLRRHDVGPVAVRRRGHPDPPEALAKRFRGPGSKRGQLLVARLDQGHRAYLVEEEGSARTARP